MTVSSDELRTIFHSSIRMAGREDEPTPGIILDSDGPVRRRYPIEPRTSYAMVECPAGLLERADHWITRQVAFFTQRAEPVEWKTYDYDQPADLGERLTRHGFVAQAPEALMLGPLQPLIQDVALPPGCTVSAIEPDDDAAFDGIRALMSQVWGGEREKGENSPTERLRREKLAAPENLDIVLARDPAGAVQCAGWVRYTPGTQFASLWGGSTSAPWRRKGLFRAVVAARARLAAGRGMRYVRVDASPDSEPVLARLGLRRVATTTPYVLAP